MPLNNCPPSPPNPGTKPSPNPSGILLPLLHSSGLCVFAITSPNRRSVPGEKIRSSDQLGYSSVCSPFFFLCFWFSFCVSQWHFLRVHKTCLAAECEAHLYGASKLNYRLTRFSFFNEWNTACVFFSEACKNVLFSKLLWPILIKIYGSRSTIAYGSTSVHLGWMDR